MAYLIDGHNLIPHVAGLSLRDIDDEAALVDRLRRFAARSGRKVTVYFDRAAHGPRRPIAASNVAVRFVALPATADAAILSHLARLGRSARQWTVVTSDEEIRRAAVRAGARTMTSQAFAQILDARPSPSGDEKPDAESDPGAIDEWAAAFSRHGRKGPRGH